MECFICGEKTRVLETRKNKEGRRYRRRECTACGEKFTTYEVNQMQLLNVLEDYLPMRLIDEISKGLAMGFPEHCEEKDF